MMATDGDIPEAVRDARWEADFQPNPSYPSYTVNTQRAGRRIIRREVWIREKRLGHGGFGVVWLEKAHSVNQLSVGKRAVKELRIAQDDHRRRGCIHELVALVKFSQKKFVDSFVEFYGWFSNKDALFIATEYCQYGDLKQFVKDTGPISEPQVQEIIYQVLQGVIFMHDSNFAHRDLKPANILIKQIPSPPDHRWHVKICDMGLSKRVGTEVTSTIVKGTPGFIAPERVPGIGSNPTTVDPFPCDMWCLGEISFFLLTSGTTFENFLELREYVNGTLGFPQERLDSVGTGASAISFVKDLMAAKPLERLSANQADSHLWMKPLDPHRLQPPTRHGQPLSPSFRSTPNLQHPDEIYKGIAEISIEQTTLPYVNDIQLPGNTQGSVTIPSASWNSTTYPRAPSPETQHLSVEYTQRSTSEEPQGSVETTPEIYESSARFCEPIDIVTGSLQKEHSSTAQHCGAESAHMGTSQEAEENMEFDFGDYSRSDESYTFVDIREPLKNRDEMKRAEILEETPSLKRKYDRMMEKAIRYINRSGGKANRSFYLQTNKNDSLHRGAKHDFQRSSMPSSPSAPSVSGSELDWHSADGEPFSYTEKGEFWSGSQKSSPSVGSHRTKRAKGNVPGHGGRAGEERTQELSGGSSPPSMREIHKPESDIAVSNYKQPTVEDAEDSDYIYDYDRAGDA
ncbi:kinase-like domain-containing protein [Xylaria telfairii]|nr:kinase-like domain-containing protein [Xylaria telfairii]